ncbi:MAG: uroporphyrinogen decarboxylase family protein [Christensenellales bacterium]
MNFEKLNLDIFEGKAGKKVLFQPRINCWYDDKVFLGQDLPGELKGCSAVEMYKKLNVSNRIYDYYGCFEKQHDKNVKFTCKELGKREMMFIYDTPVGSVNMILRGNDSNPGMYYKKWLLETPEDIRVQTYIEEGTTYRFNEDMYNELYAKWGTIGAPTMYICRTPIQECFVETMGVENTIYALYDDEDLMEKYFRAKEDANLRMIDEINKSPIRIINYGDNIHCGITSPDLFEKYIIPVYAGRYDKLKSAGKFIHSHWDGDIKSILKYAQCCYLDGIEAMTPFPQGDVSVDEIIDALGDKMILLDGIAALLFNNTYPIEQLDEQVETLISKMAGRLILGISDEMPSSGDIERVKHVRDIVEKHNRECE